MPTISPSVFTESMQRTIKTQLKRIIFKNVENLPVDPDVSEPSLCQNEWAVSRRRDGNDDNMRLGSGCEPQQCNYLRQVSHFLTL